MAEPLFLDLNTIEPPPDLSLEWEMAVRSILLERFAAELREIRCPRCNAAMVVEEMPTSLHALPGCVPTCPSLQAVAGPSTEENS